MQCVQAEGVELHLALIPDQLALQHRVIAAAMVGLAAGIVRLCARCGADDGQLSGILLPVVIHQHAGVMYVVRFLGTILLLEHGR